MKIRSEKGFTGIDIAVSVVIMFIFISVVAMLVYQVNSTSKRIELKSDAIYIAINGIEQAKINGIEGYEGKTGEIETDKEVSGTQGYYRTITVKDYKEIVEEEKGVAAAQNIEENVVKKVTVEISYMFQGKEQSVELSTILSKEN